MQGDLLYTVTEVSKLIKTNPAYVYRLISSGLLPAMKLGKLKVSHKALVDFLDRATGKDLSNPGQVVDLNLSSFREGGIK